jgi:hypothetical protein
MSTANPRENLGKEGQDKITGFTGIITACCSYITGCDQYGLAPKVNAEGKIEPTQWFDTGRVDIVGDGITGKSVQGDKNGGPSRDAPRG